MTTKKKRKRKKEEKVGGITDIKRHWNQKKTPKKERERERERETKIESESRPRPGGRGAARRRCHGDADRRRIDWRILELTRPDVASLPDWTVPVMHRLMST